MGRSYFGKASCGNSELVDRLECGGTVTLVTAEKIRSFIAARATDICQDAACVKAARQHHHLDEAQAEVAE